METKKQDQKVHIEMHGVESSQISHIGYHVDSKTLAITFKNKSGGSTYHYHDIPKQVFDDLMSAESKGKHFGQNIRHQHKGHKQ